MRKYISSLLFLCLLTGVRTAWAQQDSIPKSRNFFEVDERKLVETKWRYTYAIHLESNTIIHQAENFYDFYLHFRYNYIYEQYLNGVMSRGPWSLDGNQLQYSFKHIKNFEIASISKQAMILEFTQSNSKGTYQYHFIRVESRDAPFVKPLNELPDIIVETVNPKKRRAWLSLKKKKKRKKKKRRKKKTDGKLVYISIELIGGGYYGGLNPVLREIIFHIKSNGRLIKEFKSANSGLVVTRKNIPREELERFAEFIVNQKFFNFERQYDCSSSYCQEGSKRSLLRSL